MKCAIENCQKKQQAKGLCSGHRAKEWRKANPDRTKQLCADNHAKNREERIAKMREYGKQNRKKISEQRRIRYHTDIINRLSLNIRNRVRQGLRSQGLKKRNSPIQDLTGCNWVELRKYLENLFLPGMSWDNRSQWHIDHIKPLASFDLSDTEQLKQVCHYTNLRPLWKEDNLKKGSKIL